MDYPIGRNDCIPRLVPNVFRAAVCTCEHPAGSHRLSSDRRTRFGSVVWDREECGNCDCRYFSLKEFKKL